MDTQRDGDIWLRHSPRDAYYASRSKNHSTMDKLHYDCLYSAINCLVFGLVANIIRSLYE